MPTVQCPQCDRALQLPLEHEGATVCCPLCSTVSVFGGFANKEESPRSDIPSHKQYDAPSSVPLSALPDADREAIRQAAKWLDRVVIVALLHTLTCSSYGSLFSLMLLTPKQMHKHLELVWSSSFFPFMLCCFIFIGARNIRW